MSSILRPEIPAWKRSGSEDLEPEQLAREAIAEIQEALKGLFAIRKLLTSPKPDYDEVTSRHRG